METITTLPAMGSEAPSYTTAIFGPFRDAWLAARTRLATLAAAGTDAGAVSVEAFHGSVVLAGDVASEHVRERIERAVRQLAGVVGVDNRMRVRGAPRRRSGGGDAEIAFLVAARLRRAPDLQGSIIHARNVYDGVVTLAGTASSAAGADAAFHLVLQVPGVRRIISNDVLVAPNHVDVGSDADAA